jgi:hypothetical protein
MMLGPTHEEEITSLVASTLKSYKDLPIKLYQTSMICPPFPLSGQLLALFCLFTFSCLSSKVQG